MLRFQKHSHCSKIILAKHDFDMWAPPPPERVGLVRVSSIRRTCWVCCAEDCSDITAFISCVWAVSWCVFATDHSYNDISETVNEKDFKNQIYWRKRLCSVRSLTCPGVAATVGLQRTLVCSLSTHRVCVWPTVRLFHSTRTEDTVWLCLLTPFLPASSSVSFPLSCQPLHVVGSASSCSTCWHLSGGNGN